jgi:hypothetical protein
MKEYQRKFIEWQEANQKASPTEQEMKLREFKVAASTPVEPQAEPQRTEPSTLEALFPETTKAARAGSNFPIASGLRDAANMAQRAYFGLPYLLPEIETPLGKIGSDEISYSEYMAGKRPENRGMVGAAIDIIETPEFIPGMATGAGMTGMIPKSLSPIMKLGAYGAAGGATEVPFAATEERARVEQGQDFDPRRVTERVATGGALSAFIPASGSLLAGKKNSVASIFKNEIQGLTGMSEDALEYLGAKPLIQKAKALVVSDAKPNVALAKVTDFNKRAGEIAQGYIDILEDVDNAIRDKNVVVDDAIKNMGTIDMMPIFKKINDLKKTSGILDKELLRQYGDVPVAPGTMTADGAANEMLSSVDKLLKKVSGEAQMGLPVTQRSADDLLDIRRQIDATINYDKTKYPKAFNKSMDNLVKETRTILKDALIEQAEKTGNPQYIKAMEEYSEILQARDDIMKTLGGSQSPDRAVRFLESLGNPKKLENKQLVAKIKKLFGKDLIEDARLLDIAKQYKDGLRILPSQQTGRSMLGGMIGKKFMPDSKLPVGEMVQGQMGGSALYGGLSTMQDIYPKALRLQQRTQPATLAERTEENEQY